MRRYSFIFAVLGIFLLLIILMNLPAKKISSQDELNGLLQNQKLLIVGKVIKESLYEDKKIIYLDNSLRLQCDVSCPNYLDKNISATAILEHYNNRDYIKIIDIISLD